MQKRKIFNKLVRDKIPQILAEKLCNPETEILSNEQYISALKEKLFEECKEVIGAENKVHLTEELADVLEVMHAIANHEHIAFEEIEKTRIAKKEKRGGFDMKFFLKSSEITEKI